MCLAIPAKVVSIDSVDAAVIEVGGIEKAINISLVPDVSVGDYVVVHVGYALNRLDPMEAEKTLALLYEAGTIQQELAQ